MEMTIVVITRMSSIATCHVQTQISSVDRAAGVFLTVGDVMVMQIVKMEVMRIRQFVIREFVILKLSSAARMDDAYRNFGCVTLTMIVAMIRMSQLTCVDRETARQAGEGVQALQIIDAYRDGSSAMARMIAETIVMSCLRIVQFVTLKLISSARTIAAYRNSGRATSLTIVEMERTSLIRSARENIVNVRSLSSNVQMESASRVDGDAVSFNLSFQFYLKN